MKINTSAQGVSFQMALRTVPILIMADVISEPGLFGGSRAAARVART